MSEPTIASVWLVCLEDKVAGWSFRVRLHPEMKIETTGDPTWGQVMALYSSAMEYNGVQSYGRKMPSPCLEPSFESIYGDGLSQSSGIKMGDE